MSLISSACIVLLAIISANAFTTDQLKFQQDTLTAHNTLRARHCVAKLQLDNELSKTAQAYADHLAATNKFEHSNNGHGENLYIMGSSAVLPISSAVKATQAWYDEIKDYNYSTPGFSMATGHFTQVIWKGSTRLGVGVALANGGRRAIVVANYSPPGNFMGRFPENVLKGTC